MHAFGLEKYMAEPLIVVDGYAIAPDRPGHGIDLDLAGMAVYELD